MIWKFLLSFYIGRIDSTALPGGWQWRSETGMDGFLIVRHDDLYTFEVTLDVKSCRATVLTPIKPRLSDRA